MCNLDFTQNPPPDINCPNCGRILGEEIYQSDSGQIFCGGCLNPIDYDNAFDKLFMRQI